MNSDLIYPSFAPTDPPMTRLNSFMPNISDKGTSGTVISFNIILYHSMLP